jgi:carboxyl-terminal processing protease
MHRALPPIAHLVALVSLLLVLVATLLPAFAGAGTYAAVPLPACRVLNSPKDLLSGQQTDLQVVHQAYRGLLAHYLAGSALNDRTLLGGTWAALIGQVAGTPAGNIALGALTGHRTQDWAVFARAYTRLSGQLVQAPGVQQSLAEDAMLAMANTLHDNHTAYLPPAYMKPTIEQFTTNTPIPSYGLDTSPLTATTNQIYVTQVFPHSPAAAAALRPGDVIEQVGGAPAIAQGAPSAGLVSLLLPVAGTSEGLTVFRPATGQTLQVTLTAHMLVTPVATARILAGDIAYIRLEVFTTQAATQVTAALRGLHLGTRLRGVILDLRGNPGGDADQAVRLLSMFIHHHVVAINVNGSGKRSPQRTVNSVPLLHVPLVVLTDAGSASSSELVAGAIRDLHAGLVVGTRTAGALAGAEFYGLSDGSGLEITEVHVLGANGERIDNVGVAPNQRVLATALDLSQGQDPVIAQAVADLHQGLVPVAGATAP